MTDEYNAKKDGELSYLAAIEAKRLRGDHLKRSDADRIEALERNLFALERFVHDLQKDIQDIRKALRENALQELVDQAQELDMGYE